LQQSGYLVAADPLKDKKVTQRKTWISGNVITHFGSGQAHQNVWNYPSKPLSFEGLG
jgi:hypothetical protein